MEFSGARVLVLGLGRSGRAASLVLSELGAQVVASDSSNSAEMADVAEELRKDNIEVVLGQQSDELLKEKDLVVVSPGIPSETNVLIAAVEQGIPVWSEIELAFRITDKRIIAITGTNGKTTTTTLIGKIFEVAGKPAAVVGNIGTPLITAATDPTVETLIVEVSSFQLDNIEKFRPDIAVLLNITEDHLDWHPDFDDYVRSKKRIFMNQQENDHAVLCVDDEIVSSIATRIKPKHVLVSKRKHGQEHGVKGMSADIFIKENNIVMNLSKFEQEETIVCGIDELKIPGDHNLDNIMAAIGACHAAGIDIEPIREAIIGFEGLSHRIEFVASVDNVEYYDDSKATNVDATVKAVKAFNKPLVLMVGGRNKGNSFMPLAGAIHAGVKAVIGFGESGREILSQIPQDVVKKCAESVPEATMIASEIAEPGYVVLFSPACASFDAFKSYAERGDVFKSAVLSLRRDK